MDKLAKIFALLGLALTVLAPILAAFGTIDLSQTKTAMFIGMLVWFIGATPWLGFKKLKPSDTEVEI